MAAPLGSEAPRGITRWLILVAADQVELYEHLREALRDDQVVEVALERRKNPGRIPAWLREHLRSHGAVVIPKQL
jgi:hypothetical protein